MRLNQEIWGFYKVLIIRFAVLHMHKKSIYYIATKSYFGINIGKAVTFWGQKLIRAAQETEQRSLFWQLSYLSVEITMISTLWWRVKALITAALPLKNTVMLSPELWLLSSLATQVRLRSRSTSQCSCYASTAKCNFLADGRSRKVRIAAVVITWLG